MCLQIKNKNKHLKRTYCSIRFQVLMTYLIICFDKSHGIAISPFIACRLEKVNYSLQNIYYETV